MTRSVRVSDELCQSVWRDTELMCRPISQQLGFVARLGLALEGSPGITARQFRALANQTGGSAAAPAPAEELESAFAALASMDGNPELKRRLAQAGRPVPGRDAPDRLVHPRLDADEDSTATG